MQEEEEAEEEEAAAHRGSGSGEMEAGLQMDTGAAALLLLLTAGIGVLEGGVNCPLAPLSELASRTGELFFFTGLLSALFGAPVPLCWACCRCFARRFLNQTWRKNNEFNLFNLASKRQIHS